MIEVADEFIPSNTQI